MASAVASLALVLVVLPSSVAIAGPRSYAGPVDTAGTPVAEPTEIPTEAAPLETVAPPREAAPLEIPKQTKPKSQPEIDPLGIRVVRVDTDALRGSTREAAFRHAGGRSVI